LVAKRADCVDGWYTLAPFRSDSGVRDRRGDGCLLDEG